MRSRADGNPQTKTRDCANRLRYIPGAIVRGHKVGSGRTTRDPVRHHYTPRFYLAGFVDEEGLVCAYEKGKPGGFRGSPKNVGLETNFYTVATHDNPKNTAIVEGLMTIVDDKAAPILAKLVHHETISVQEKLDFSFFMAFMYLRVPAFREFSQQTREGIWKRSMRALASDDEAFAAHVRSLEDAKGETMPDEIRKEIRRMYVDENSYSVTWDKEHHLAHLTQADELGKSMLLMRWSLHEAPKDKHFITSDNPFLMVSSDDPNLISGLRKTDVSVTFPLNRSILLEATWQPEAVTYDQVPESAVTTFNRRSIRAASRFVFASYRSKPLDRLVQQGIGTAPRAVFTTFHDPDTNTLLIHQRLAFGDRANRSTK